MAWAIGVALAGLTLLWLAWNLTLDALWQPTDRATVRRLLFVSELQAGEQLIDLGCGDGRIVIAAAREYDAQTVGVEIDPMRVMWARAWAFFAGVAKTTRIVRGNMYTYDVSGADVVILFLSATSNFRLQERLRRTMKPGSRLVSYYHPMWGWTPDTVGESVDGYPIYMYRMGAHREAVIETSL